MTSYVTATKTWPSHGAGRLRVAVPGGAGAGPAADTGSGPEELTADISELPEDREGGCRGPSWRL